MESKSDSFQDFANGCQVNLRLVAEVDREVKRPART
jgi:hypothetical protein